MIFSFFFNSVFLLAPDDPLGGIFVFRRK